MDVELAQNLKYIERISTYRLEGVEAEDKRSNCLKSYLSSKGGGQGEKDLLEVNNMLRMSVTPKIITIHVATSKYTYVV